MLCGALQVVALQEARMLHPGVPIDCVVSLGVGVVPGSQRASSVHSYFEAGYAVVENATSVYRAHEALAATLDLSGAMYARCASRASKLTHTCSLLARFACMHDAVWESDSPQLAACHDNCPFMALIAACKPAQTMTNGYVSADSTLWTSALASLWTALTPRRSMPSWRPRKSMLTRKAMSLTESVHCLLGLIRCACFPLPALHAGG